MQSELHIYILATATENKILKIISFNVEASICIGRSWTNAVHDFYEEGN